MADGPEPRVFLSYARRDAESAAALHEALQREGMRVWRDTSEIDVGNPFRADITNAIRSSDVFVLAVSANSVRSEEVLSEAELAKELRKPILPAYLERVETGMPDRFRLLLSGRDRAELYKDFGNGVARLVRSLKKQAALGVSGRDTRSAFDSLERVGVAGAAALAAEYEAALSVGRVDGPTLVSLGQCYIFLGRFEEAREILRRSVATDPASAEAAFSLALSIVAGRRPRALRMRTAEEIARLLDKAAQIDPQSAHYDYLAALVKADYYEGHGLLVPDPSVETLLARAASKRMDPSELRRISNAVKVDEGVWGRMTVEA